jgi:hypothetical protein
LNLNAAKKELEAAKRSLNAMKTASTFEVFDEEWRDFLNCLEKVWNKTERSCQHVRNKFEPWQGKYSALRRKDMLLRYLKQARDADNHSIQEVDELKPGHTAMNFVNPEGGHVKHMELRGSEIVHYEGDPMIVTHHPPTIEAVRIKNSGNWYNPPTTHLDQKVESIHPVVLAELGFKFYDEFLKEAEKIFFEEKP